jgi:predicted DCC family thiol-disulfide oxidoreductase YuxK
VAREEPDGASGGGTPAAAPPARLPTAAAADRPIVLYDGWCNLCDSSVAFILRRDRNARFRFAALQSSAGLAARATCAELGRLDGTLIVVERGRCHTRSTALLTILGQLPAPWPVLTVLRLIPRRTRDWAYDIVARNRTRWFGQPRVCMTSLAGYRDRFVE